MTLLSYMRVIGCTLALAYPRGDASAQLPLVVDIAVESVSNDSLHIHVVGERRAFRFSPQQQYAARGDTLVMRAPVTFSVDMSQTAVMVMSTSAAQIRLYLTDPLGSMQGRGRVISLRKHPKNTNIELVAMP